MHTRAKKILDFWFKETPSKKRFQKQKFPNAEKLAKYGISLPIDPNLKTLEVKKICRILNKIK